MNRKVICCLLIVFSFLIITGCNYKKESLNNTDVKTSNSTKDNMGDSDMVNSVIVKINDIDYKLNLENNETVKSLINLLPVDLLMDELNGNEKYVYLDEKLPAKSTFIKHIKKGDVMLFGDNCLVIFYKSFDTSYSYTKIGHIDNLGDLGNGSVKVNININ